jgi:hypothetical protein
MTNLEIQVIAWICFIMGLAFRCRDAPCLSVIFFLGSLASFIILINGESNGGGPLRPA